MVELILIAIMFLAAGAMAFSALRRTVSGEIRPRRCSSCGDIAGRGYAACKHCGAEL